MQISSRPLEDVREAAAGGPVWLDTLRRRGERVFAETGLPSRRQEAWKYTDLGPARAIPFRPASGADARAPAVVPQWPTAAGMSDPVCRLVFVCGRLRPDLSVQTDGVPGVTIGSLVEMLASDGTGIEPLLGQIAGIDGQPLSALNTSRIEDGCLIRIGVGHELRRPIEIVHLGGAGEEPLMFQPRALIVLQEGAAATIFERHVGIGNADYFANGVTEVDLAAGTRLRHYKLQTESEQAWHLSTTAVRLGRDAAYESFVLSLGGRLARNEIAVSLPEPGATCTLAGAYLIRGRQHCDTTTRVDHMARDTACREIFKGVIDDAGRGVFQGTIVVHPGAVKTDARQQSRALLLSDAAEADQKPELEIYADDVKCSHGAAAGQLDQEALFYLRSRGIDETQARQLLIEGFLGEAFETIAHEEIRSALFETARAWLPTAERRRLP
jgi:Fe-S cluster assembly protein SufD